MKLCKSAVKESNRLTFSDFTTAKKIKIKSLTCLARLAYYVTA